MTERYPEQTPNNQFIWPLSPDEVALAQQEREEARRADELAKQHRAEGLAKIEQMLGITGGAPDIRLSAPAHSRALQPEQPSLPSVESEPIVDRGRLLVDGKPVNLSPRVSDAQRQAYIQTKRDEGSKVEFASLDEDELASSQAADSETTNSLSREVSLNARMGLTEDEGSFPLRKNRFDFVKDKRFVGVGVTALLAVSLAGGAVVLAKPSGDTDGATANVAGSDVVNAAAEKKIDMKALISDCAPDKIGAPIASGTMSVDAGVVWNIPGTTEQFPKLNLGAWDHDNNPATEPAPEPRFLPLTANNITVSMAVCDPADTPAVLLKDDVLHVKLDEVSPQIAFEASAENAPELSALAQADLNKLVTEKKWMSQDAANTLRTNMTSPEMAVAATKETLHGVVEQMKKQDSKTGLAVVAALKSQLQAGLAKQLPAKADGKPYEVVFDGELANTRLSGIGVDVVKNEAFAIDTPRIVVEKLTPAASEKK